MKIKKIFFTSLLFFPLFALAETHDFGGYTERYKGGGDKIPPRCQIELPSASTTSFFVKWNCSDDNSDSQEIRSELWLYKKGAPTGQLIANFLGFPAAVNIDESLLGVTTFTEALPFSVKLLARDETGMTTISPQLIVQAQDNSVETCNLSLLTEATEASGSTTGTPALAVAVDKAKVSVSQSSSSQLTVTTIEKSSAEPCEIDSVCFDDSRLTFSSNMSFSSASSSIVSGTLSIIPGSLVVNVAGTANISGLVLQDLEVSGTTTINGASTAVSLSCSK